MFGLTEYEIDLYSDLVQDFAVKQVTPSVVYNSTFTTPAYEGEDGEVVPDQAFLRRLLTDIETIITVVATRASFDYAHLQSELEDDESDIIKHLHTKYTNQAVYQFIKYGVAFTESMINEIIGEIIIELPYLYQSVIEDTEFDSDEFLEERLAAYDDYINETFSDVEEDDTSDGD